LSCAPQATHKHIKTTKRGHCIIYRTSKKIVEAREAKKEADIPGLLQLSFTIEESQNKEQEQRKNVKRFRGTETSWKCDICKKPICLGEQDGVSYQD
jgi:hypothetical protein